MKFAEVVKHKPGSNLVISPRHERWMEKNANPKYSPAAQNFMVQELTKTQRERKGTVSASSLGSCKRQQQFTYIGMPKIPPSAKTAAVFQTGTFMHLRWQMAGLSEGWLVKAEESLPANRWMLSGTMDGIAHDGSVVEFKSINSNGFRNVMTFGAKPEHRTQLGAYLLATGIEKGVFIYEDKDTQEYIEIPQTATELPLNQIADRINQITAANAAKDLFEPLDECMAGKGKFNWCPFRKECLGIREWEEAEHADQAS